MPTAISSPEPAEEVQIRSAPRPACALCGGDGVIIYRKLRDRLFGAPETWDFRQCSDPKCGLIWLDPMPLTEDIGRAYANYYTHGLAGGPGRPGLLKRLYAEMERGYWAGAYGDPAGSASFSIRSFGKLLYLFPIRRNGMDAETRYLPAVPQGRLLDVGCGSGEWLLAMREFGWNVEGVDFDENAVKAARKKGLEIGCGALEQQNFASEKFDAVTLNHVIEHVPDPVGTLAECSRILKSGGRLVLLTPNSSSLGHSFFKQDWRGLEPPRHLHVFSTRSMDRLLERAGFKKRSVSSHIARSVIHESILLRRSAGGPKSHRNWSSGVMTQLFNLAEWVQLGWNPAAADCVAAVAVKE